MFPEVIFGLITLYLIQLLMAAQPEDPPDLTVFTLEAEDQEQVQEEV